MGYDTRPYGVRYLVIADVLRSRIRDGSYPTRTQLPSEQDLSVECQCGRDTLRDALDVLRGEDLIVKERGRRATVAPTPDYATVVLLPGTTVQARMPTRPELPGLGCRASTPLFVVTPASGIRQLHPADRTQLTTAP